MVSQDWKTVLLKDVCYKPTYGHTDSAVFVLKNREQDFVYKFLRITDIQENQVDWTQVPYCVSTEELPHKYLLRTGDIVIARIGSTTGKAYSLDNPPRNSVFASYLIRIRAKNDILAPSFLKYVVSSSDYWKYIDAEKSGIKVGVNIPILNEFPILLPPLPEQRKIAQILGAWDTAIHTTEQIIEAKQQLKKGLMQLLLTGKLRFREFEGQKWKTVKLKDVFQRVIRKNEEGNTNVVTISAQKGFVKQTDFFSKNIASEKLDNYFLVKKGEFCYNKSYSNGYPWGATKRLNGFSKAVVTTLYICFGIIEEEKTSGDFFEQFFEANRLNKGLTQIAYEGGRAHGLLNVTPTDFFSLQIVVPNKREQSAIAQVLRAADKEIQLLKEQLAALKLQKKGLLQQLLTGRVRCR